MAYNVRLSYNVLSCDIGPIVYINKMIYICYTGLGIGTVQTLCISFPAFYFDKHRGVALSIVPAGMGLGIVVFPQTYTWIMELYNWRIAMLWTGAFVLQVNRTVNIIEPPHSVGHWTLGISCVRVLCRDT